MRILLLVAGGRAGSDFFHSLLDGHSNILKLIKKNLLVRLLKSQEKKIILIS